jgi:D-alanine transaminase
MESWKELAGSFMAKWPSRSPPGRIAYVNGRYLAHGAAGVHIEDRGLQFGDSIYEVWGVRGGRLLDEAGHLDRLERSLKTLELPMPMPREALRFVLREVMRRNRMADGLLYLQVTRGAFRRDHPIPADAGKPTLIVTARAIAPAAFAAKLQDGITVITQPDLRWAWRDIKTTQLLPNLLAKTAARRAGAGEAWLVDDEGFVTEGGSANAWIVTAAGDVVTHPLGHDILPGVTRGVVMAAAREEGIVLQERKFTVAEVLAAREAFITGASGAAVPVLAIDGKPIGDGRPGALTLRLQSLYARKTGS